MQTHILYGMEFLFLLSKPELRMNEILLYIIYLVLNC